MNHAQIASEIIDTEFLMKTALERIRHLEAEVQRLQLKLPQMQKFIWIYQSQKLIKIPLTEILYIQSESNYSRIFLKGGRQYFMSRTLKSWLNEIPASDFLRCHRSFLINKKEIIEINRNANQILMQEGVMIPISRRHQKDDVLSIMSDDHQGKNVLFLKLNVPFVNLAQR